MGEDGKRGKRRIEKKIMEGLKYRLVMRGDEEREKRIMDKKKIDRG